MEKCSVSSIFCVIVLILFNVCDSRKEYPGNFRVQVILNEVYQCMGAIIGTQQVLVSGRCVTDDRKQFKKGSWHVMTVNQNLTDRKRVEKMYAPQLLLTKHIADIAVLKVDGWFLLEDKIYPANIYRETYVGRNATLNIMDSKGNFLSSNAQVSSNGEITLNAKNELPKKHCMKNDYLVGGLLIFEKDKVIGLAKTNNYCKKDILYTRVSHFAHFIEHAKTNTLDQYPNMIALTYSAI